MIVVTGVDGQLGSAFRRLLGTDEIFLSRAELDLEDRPAIRGTLGALRPDMIINCAAYTAVDAAESDRERAFAVNATAVGEMARAADELGSKFVTVSTDYVFDGSSTSPYLESSSTNPINVYGASKLAGEEATLSANPDALVVRTSWLLSGTHPNFVATMIRLARKQPLNVVNDQTGNPTFVDDLAAGILSAVGAGATGIIHLVNQGSTTWYELARSAVRLAGIDPGDISPCTTEAYPTPARRPHSSVLGSERLSTFGIDPLPPHGDGLKALVDTLARNGIT